VVAIHLLVGVPELLVADRALIAGLVDDVPVTSDSGQFVASPVPPGAAAAGIASRQGSR
jgi:hypothetical protein